MDAPSHAHRLALLALACDGVTPADVATYAPRIDPSYPGYVRRLTLVLRSKGRATTEPLDWEPVFHAIEADPQRPRDAAAFRCYRVFVLAAAMAFEADLGGFVEPAALALGLLEDARALDDAGLWARARLAFAEYHDELAARHAAAAPFLTLACLLGCVLANRSEARAAGITPAERRTLAAVDARALAARLMREEAEHHGAAASARRSRYPAAFLWSCTLDQRHHDRWLRFVAEALSPTDAALAPLRTALLTDA